MEAECLEIPLLVGERYESTSKASGWTQWEIGCWTNLVLDLISPMAIFMFLSSWLSSKVNLTELTSSFKFIVLFQRKCFIGLRRYELEDQLIKSLNQVDRTQQMIEILQSRITFNQFRKSRMSESSNKTKLTIQTELMAWSQFLLLWHFDYDLMNKGS